MAEPIKTPHVDRTGWRPGPWDGEGDREEWRDPATGLPCCAKRVSEVGTWCGYVGVGPDHPLHGADYVEEGTQVLTVHGGVTFAGPCAPEAGICHVPQPGEVEDVWWFGFDCAHWGDRLPGMAAIDAMLAEQTGEHLRMVDHGTYRDLDYVKAECAALAWQLQLAGLA